MEGDTTFHFITGGIREALDRGREVAAGMDVRRASSQDIRLNVRNPTDSRTYALLMNVRWGHIPRRSEKPKRSKAEQEQKSRAPIRKLKNTRQRSRRGRQKSKPKSRAKRATTKIPRRRNRAGWRNRDRLKIKAASAT